MGSEMQRNRGPKRRRMAMAWCALAATTGLSLHEPCGAQNISTFSLNPADQIPADRKEPKIADGFMLAATGDLVGPEIPVMDLEEPEMTQLVAILKSASLAVGNAETPIFDYSRADIYPAGGESQPVKPPAIAKEYARMGFRVLNMAFNHAGDWSPQGLEQTKELLNGAGIETMGYGVSRTFAQQPAYVNTRFGRVAFVGVTTTLSHVGANATDAAGLTRARPGVSALRLNADKSYNAYDAYTLLRAVRGAKDTSDFAVLFVHSHEPPDLFRNFYHMAVDAGADAVIATDTVPDHRGIEIYRGVPIFFGLNPFFYSMFELSTPSADRYESLDVDPRSVIPRDIIEKQFRGARMHPIFNSVIGMLKTSGGRVSEIRLIPIELREDAEDWRNGHPRLADPKQGLETLTAIAKASEVYGTKIRIEKNVGIIQIP